MEDFYSEDEVPSVVPLHTILRAHKLLQLLLLMQPLYMHSQQSLECNTL